MVMVQSAGHMSKLSSRARTHTSRLQVQTAPVVKREIGTLSLSYVAGHSTAIHINRRQGAIIEPIVRDVPAEIERMERTQGHRCTCGKVYENSAMLPNECSCGRSLHSHYWANADRLVTQLPPARGDYAGRMSVDGCCPMCGTPTDHGRPVCGCTGYSIERTDNSAAVFHAQSAMHSHDRRSHWHQPGDGTLRDDRDRRVLGAGYFDLSVVKRSSKAKKVVRKTPKTHEYAQRASNASNTLKVDDSETLVFKALYSITDTELYEQFRVWARSMERMSKVARIQSA